MKSLGQGSDEATEVPVLVLVSRLLRRACHEWRLGSRRTGRAVSQPRPSSRNKPGDRAGEPNNRGKESVPGLADWLLAPVAALSPAVRLAHSCSGASVVDA